MVFAAERKHDIGLFSLIVYLYHPIQRANLIRKMKKILLSLSVFVLLAGCQTADTTIFNHVEKLCNNDNGKLWGLNLYSPVLGIDSLRNVVSNVPDAPQVFPEDMPVANSTTELDGKRWTIVLWPIPGDERAQSILLIHEMFHYRQPELGLAPDRNPNNAHLSNRDARTLLKLEWNALKKAVSSKGERKKAALVDALSFRTWRWHLYPGSVADECALEILEGLSEYTGRRIAFPSDKAYIRDLSYFDYLYELDNLTRSFAYLSGPLYGMVLDQSGYPWQKEMKADSDLGSVVMKSYGIELPEDLETAVETAKVKYGFDEIDEVEQSFQTKKEERDEEIRRMFAPGNVIVLDSPNLSIQFPPNGMIQQEDGSMVIYDGEVYCDWGYVKGHPLKVTGDWRHVELPRLDTLSVRGDTVITSGWTLIKKQ